MRLILRAAAIAAGFALPSPGMSAQAAPDAFADACASRGKASAKHCACESRLARGALNAREQAAMIRAMRGDSDGFRASIAAMGPGLAQSFVGKMQKLQARTETECR